MASGRITAETSVLKRDEESGGCAHSCGAVTDFHRLPEHPGVSPLWVVAEIVQDAPEGIAQGWANRLASDEEFHFLRNTTYKVSTRLGARPANPGCALDGSTGGQSERIEREMATSCHDGSCGCGPTIAGV